MGQYNYSITAQLKKTDITPIFLSSLFPTFYTAVQQYKKSRGVSISIASISVVNTN